MLLGHNYVVNKISSSPCVEYCGISLFSLHCKVSNIQVPLTVMCIYCYQSLSHQCSVPTLECGGVSELFYESVYMWTIFFVIYPKCYFLHFTLWV